MTKATLLGTRAREGEVRAVKQPKFTKTWHPWAHGTTLNVLAEAIEKEGLKPIQKEYSLSNNGDNMFGVWEIQGMETKEVRLAIGFRSSISKQLAWAVGVGERVFVCSNLIFKAQFIELRRHTAGLDESVMITMAQRAIHQIVTKEFDEIKAWHENLKGISLEERRCSVLIVRALKRKIIRPSQFDQFIELYESKRYSKTLHGLHGAMTEVVRDERLFRVERRTRQIAEFIDEAAGKKKSLSSSTQQ